MDARAVTHVPYLKVMSVRYGYREQKLRSKVGRRATLACLEVPCLVLLLPTRYGYPPGQTLPAPPPLLLPRRRRPLPFLQFHYLACPCLDDQSTHAADHRRWGHIGRKGGLHPESVSYPVVSGPALLRAPLVLADLSSLCSALRCLALPGLVVPFSAEDHRLAIPTWG